MNTKKAIPIHEAKTNLSKYIKQAQAGKTVYIGSYGRAQAILTFVPKQPKSPWGKMKGRLWVSDKAWGEATEEVNGAFEKSNIFPNVD